MKKLCKNLWLLILALMIVPGYSLSAQAATKNKSKKFIVVIDAGHGGKDIGAAADGIYEKDINLAVAKRLGDLIEKKLKNEVSVIYTRSKDEAISLADRANIANKAKADLFISIHTNSVDPNAPNRETVSGAEVYTMGDHVTEENMNVARRENSVVALFGGKQETIGFDPNDDASYIAFEMAQKDNINKSMMFANDVQKELVKTAGRKDRGTRQAGFAVLKNTVMPGALIELDFICNPEEVKFLSSTDGQKKLAQAIFNGLDKYIKDQKRLAIQNRNKAKQEDVNPAGFKSEATIETAQNKRIVSEAPKQSTASNRQVPRKRRNDASRRASSSRNIDMAVLDSPVSQNSVTTSLPAAAPAESPLNNSVTESEPAPQQASARQTAADGADDHKAATAKKTVNKPAEQKPAKKYPMKEQTASKKKTVTKQATANNSRPVNIQKAAQPRKQQAAKNATASNSTKKSAEKVADTNPRPSSQGKVKARLNTYYSVQLCESNVPLKDDASLAKYGKNVNEFKENGKYIYTLGQYDNRQDTVPVINKVRKEFPGAKQVRINANTRKIVH